MVKPVAVFGSETWDVAEMDMTRLGKGERKVRGRDDKCCLHLNREWTGKDILMK